MISFIVIGINEERNINRCIESIIFLGQKSKLEFEIIYVDSGSTDKTLNIVNRSSCVKIIQVKSNQNSAALSRYIGSIEAKGDYLFFLDGDMEVREDVDIDNVLEMLGDDVGVVSGRLEEYRYKNDLIVEKVKDRYNVSGEVDKLKSPGGYFLCKKKILQKSGNFNCNIKCNEEIELFVRIKKLGLKLIRTNKITCIHHDYKFYNKLSDINRFNNNYYRDVLNVLFIQVKNKTLRQYFSFSGSINKWIMILLFTIQLFSLIFIIVDYRVLFGNIIFFLILLFRYKFNVKYLYKVISSSYLTIISILKLKKRYSLDYTYKINKE